MIIFMFFFNSPLLLITQPFHIILVYDLKLTLKMQTTHMVKLFCQQNQPSIPMSLPGSKPKKIWRKSNPNNPTFSSYLMNSILVIPDSYAEELPKHSQSRRDRNIDSLQQAQLDFKQGKQNRNHSVILIREPQELNNNSCQLSSRNDLSLDKKLGRREQITSNPSLPQSSHKQYKEFYTNPELRQTRIKFRKLNYLDSKGIQKKQLHAYNILNGY